VFVVSNFDFKKFVAARGTRVAKTREKNYDKNMIRMDKYTRGKTRKEKKTDYINNKSNEVFAIDSARLAKRIRIA